MARRIGRRQRAASAAGKLEDARGEQATRQARSRTTPSNVDGVGPVDARPVDAKESPRQVAGEHARGTGTVHSRAAKSQADGRCSASSAADRQRRNIVVGASESDELDRVVVDHGFGGGEVRVQLPLDTRGGRWQHRDCDRRITRPNTLHVSRTPRVGADGIESDFQAIRQPRRTSRTQFERLPENDRTRRSRVAGGKHRTRPSRVARATRDTAQAPGTLGTTLRTKNDCTTART